MTIDHEQWRYFLKDHVRSTIDFSQTEQNRGLPPPPFQKETTKGQQKVMLPPVKDIISEYPVTICKAIQDRKSLRNYSNEPLTLQELSLLLWATQGYRATIGPYTTLRTVPSAGSRHSFETYLYIRNVEELEEGIYRYLPLSHELVIEELRDGIAQDAAHACRNQLFVATSSLVFFWSTVPKRTEWRYGDASAKVIAIDAGHVCQNLYLACEAIGAGTCAIAAYDQDAADSFLNLDGEEEFVVYIAPVGKRPG